MALERSTVVGVFGDISDAARAMEELLRIGLREDQIGFLTREDGYRRFTELGTTGRTAAGALTGIVAGAGVGGILAAAASLLIPGFGPIVAGGILATTLGGAEVGAATGLLVGALSRSGVPNDEGRQYESAINEGRVLVIVRAGSRSGEVQDVLRRFGAHDVEDQEAVGARARTQLTDANLAQRGAVIADDATSPDTRPEEPRR